MKKVIKVILFVVGWLLIMFGGFTLSLKSFDISEQIAINTLGILACLMGLVSIALSEYRR